MRVHVLHHARCFDGAASAALFTAFLRAHLRRDFEAVFLPKRHQRGDPFEDADFEGADEAAVVDFRYTQHPGLSWYFDHHRSAFQLPGDRAHFEADRSGQKFHDAQAPSCAGYIARVAADRFGFNVEPHAELIRWAEIVDSADFASPAEPVLCETPALQLAAWIQGCDDGRAITRFIEALLTTPLAELAGADWIRAGLEPRLAAQRADTELLRRVGDAHAGLFEYDLLDHGPRALNHFIPYYLAGDIRYSLGAYAHLDGDLRLSVGFNPWLPAGAREHDLARLAERYGGGGHPFVAGASFAPDQVELLRTAKREIAAVLRSPA